MSKSRFLNTLLLTATLLLAGCTGDAAEEDTAPPNDGPELSTYSFEGSDSAQDNSVNGEDELLQVVMTQGSPISWAAVEVRISVDDGAPMVCEPQDSSASCTYDLDNDQEWSAGEEIIISEGQDNLCSAGCNIAVTIENTQQSKILGSIEVSVS
jgi:hypothetical protein